jgi:UDP-N-acetyl-D-mannosaminuronate dehydrogenase
MNKKNILFIGAGEVGSSLINIYKKHLDKFNLYYEDPGKDIDLPTVKDSNTTHIDVMHICIPYIHTFKEVVINYITVYTPTLVIIHSTVDIGVTRHIFNKTLCNIVHSPVMGVHPNLSKGILTFKKIIGAIDTESADMAVKHLKEVNINTVIYNKPEESEAAKLLSTTYYGLNILYMKKVYQLCKQYNIDFNNVYKETNEIYNEGFPKLGKSNVVRPILKPMTGKIGGHCVRQNCEILSRDFLPAKLVLEFDENVI